MPRLTLLLISGIAARIAALRSDLGRENPYS
jgi:hypothetical protein